MFLGIARLGSCAGEAECGEQSLSPQRPLCSPALQVYSATNVELVTRTRTEHLSDQDKSRSKGKLRCACLLPSHTMWWVTWVWEGQCIRRSWEVIPFPPVLSPT